MRRVIKEKGQNGLIFCTFCGELLPLRKYYTFMGVFYRQEKPVQCPHCSALMDYVPFVIPENIQDFRMATNFDIHNPDNVNKALRKYTDFLELIWSTNNKEIVRQIDNGLEEIKWI